MLETISPKIIVGFSPSNSSRVVEESPTKVEEPNVFDAQKLTEWGKKLNSVFEEAREKAGSYSLTTFFSELIGGKMSSELEDSFLRLVPSEKEREEIITFFGKLGDLMEDLLDSVDSSLFELGKAKDEKEKQEIKIRLASFNQRLSFALLSASELPADDPERIYVESFVSFLEAVLKDRFDKPAVKMRNIINGARAQSALCGLLVKEGWMVIVPDWDSEEEIRDFDLKGVDLVAVSPKGEIVFVDVKGGMFDKETHMKNYSASVEPKKREDLPVQKVIDYLQRCRDIEFRDHCQNALSKAEGEDSIYSYRVVCMPTNDLVIDPLGQIMREHYKSIKDAVIKAF